MKALSIRQPLAWAILHAGKDVENRDWQRSPGLVAQARALIGQRIAIHASRTFNIDDCFIVREIGGAMPPLVTSLPVGGIVGTARLVSVLRPGEHKSPWRALGQWGLVLAEPFAHDLAPLRGQQGFFDVPADLKVKLS